MSREYTVEVVVTFGPADMLRPWAFEEELEERWGLTFSSGAPPATLFEGSVTLGGGRTFDEFGREVQCVVWRTLRRYVPVEICGTLMQPTDRVDGTEAAFEAALEGGSLDVECQYCGRMIPWGAWCCACDDAEEASHG